MLTINEKTTIEIMAMIKLLVHAAKIIAVVTSPAERGAYKISTIFPCMFPIIIDEDEWENACWIICIAINPGARKLINVTPNTFPLSSPIAKERTSKNNKEVIKGEKSVWIQTFKNLRISFLYNVQTPIQFTSPNLLTPISYFFSNSTRTHYIY